MKPYIKENIIKNTPLEKVKVKGYTKELMDIFFEKRIFSDHGKNVVFKEAEDAFRNCIDDSTSVGLWQGEFWGKWIISAARVCKYTNDAELKEFLHNAALTLIGFQRENGYIGTYKNSKNFMSPAPTEEVIREMGWPCNWNWNIWCRKYTLWGLLECYDLTGDENILNACVRLTDNLLSELKETGRKLGETGTFKGMPSCSILKPMLILYRITEDEKYLSFCLNFVKDWENSEIMPGLIANTLSKKTLGQWYDFNIKWAKAYEMMSCFDGLAELYRVTGEEKYLKACENFYDIVIENELNPLYSVAFNDEFRDAKFNVNVITEPCDVIHWMRVCHELFTLTGNAKYMDSFELAFYNPFLASSYKDGMWGARGARGHGRHLTVDGQAGMKHNHCCVNNMPRGYMNMAESCVMTGKNSIYINLYTETEATVGNGIKVVIEGDYLADSSAKITVDFGSAAPYEIKLRIPSWSKSNKVIADGKEYNPESGYFTTLPTESKAVIEVEFDNSIKIIPIDAHKELPEDEWKLKRRVSANTLGEGDPDTFLYDSRCVLRKGAILLCRTKLIGNTEEEMFGDNLIDTSYKCTFTKAKPADGVNMQLDITLENNYNRIVTKVCDYASGTNIIADNMRYFSIYF